MTAGDIEMLRALEESLWREETRFDRSYVEEIFAPGFFEFGRSGRIYSRKESIGATPRRIDAKLPLKDFRVHPIREDVALVTYVTEAGPAGLEKGNRSSLWVRNGGRWQIVFHQGTPVSLEEKNEEEDYR